MRAKRQSPRQRKESAFHCWMYSAKNLFCLSPCDMWWTGIVGLIRPLSNRKARSPRVTGPLNPPISANAHSSESPSLQCTLCNQSVTHQSVTHHISVRTTSTTWTASWASTVSAASSDSDGATKHALIRTKEANDRNARTLMPTILSIFQLLLTQ